jgi:enoyl-CoA hydratase/carnithine racemase
VGYEDLQGIRVDVAGGVAWATVDFPPMNLWGGELGAELAGLIHTVERDGAVRVLVLASADPDFFIAHGDVEGILKIPREPAPPLTQPNVAIALADRLRTMPKATIAMVAGTARGGGSELALSCDLRYAGRSARLGQPEVPLGIIPGAGGTQRLSRLVGRARALEIILTGADYTADEAAALGWVNRVLPDDELEPFVRRIARRIAAMPASSIGAAKRAVDAAWPDPGPGFATEGTLFHETLLDDEAPRRMQRFLDLGGQTRTVEREDIGSLIDQLADNPEASPRG